MEKLVGIVLWLACGYVGAAEFSGHFYGKYGPMGVETKGTAARASCAFILAGPVYMFVGWTLSEYPPMWDWPVHIFEHRPVRP